MSPPIQAPKNKVVAFYSFKGGTGRTMALANVACLLAQSSSTSGKILIIDWDLEAPGLHRYLKKYLRRAFADDQRLLDSSPGVIDLFIAINERIEAVDIVRSESSSRELNDEALVRLWSEVALNDYIVDTDIPTLSFLKAGRFDADYATKVTTFDWPRLYRRQPTLIRSFAERLCADYEYVFIDSRTGLTDTSGICTMLMPEVIVAVFTPNEQSVAGVIDVIEQAGSYRANSDDLRPLVVYPLPSRIEASEPVLRDEWRFGNKRDKGAAIQGFQPAFEKAFSKIYSLEICDLKAYFDDVQIQHVPRYAYGEEIAVLVEKTRDRLSLSRSYQRFADILVEGAAPWIIEAGGESSYLDTNSDIASGDRQKRIELSRAIQEATEQMATYKRMAYRFYTYERITRATMLLLAVSLPVLYMTGFAKPVEAWLGATSAGLTLLIAVSSFFSFAERGSRYRSAASAVMQELEIVRLRNSDSVEGIENLTAEMQRQSALVAGGILPINRQVKIFISYRRSDSAHEAGRLYDALTSYFGREFVFIDVETIRAGANFRDSIERAVDSADVLLVVIGPEWTDPAEGSRRLDSPSDYLRVELEVALRREKTVIPVMVRGARMPSSDMLPADLQKIAYLNGVQLRPDPQWQSDVARLIHELERLSPSSRQKASRGIY